jgi:uncharacterized protein YggE
MAGPAALRAQAPAPAPTSATLVPLVTVSATGEEQVTPDRAKVMLGVQTQAPTAAQAAAANARLQRAVLDTLRGLGIAAEQISTSGYNVFPDQEFDPQTRRTRLKGYNVQNTVVVDVRRLEQVGPVLDAALGRARTTSVGCSSTLRSTRPCGAGRWRGRWRTLARTRRRWRRPPGGSWETW